MGDLNYTGAPDECSIHWPEKLDENGNCRSCLESKPVMLTPRLERLLEEGN